MVISLWRYTCVVSQGDSAGIKAVYGYVYMDICIWIADCDPGSVYGSSLVLSGWMGWENYTWFSRYRLNLPPNLSAAVHLFFWCSTALVWFRKCPLPFFLTACAHLASEDPASMTCALLHLYLPTPVFSGFSSWTGWCWKKGPPLLPARCRWCP